MPAHHLRDRDSREPHAPAQAADSSRDSVRTIALLDTAAASTNLGDQIIMEAVRHEIDDLFPESMVFTLTSHERMGAHSRHLIRQADWAISGGTSLLSSRMWFRPSWRVTADRCPGRTRHRAPRRGLAPIPACAGSVLPLDAQAPAEPRSSSFRPGRLHAPDAGVDRHHQRGQHRLSHHVDM